MYVLTALCIIFSYRVRLLIGTGCAKPETPSCESEKLPCDLDGVSSGENEECMSTEFWCKLVKMDFRCHNHQNLNLSKCLRVPFSLEIDSQQIDYLLAKIQTDWEIAEIYCQSHGYNLASFKTQREFDAVRDELNKLAEDGRSWVDSQGTVTDLLGQHCWDDFKKASYWLGLFYNIATKEWTYSNGQPVNTLIETSFNDNLKSVIDGFLAAKHKLRIKWYPHNDFQSFTQGGSVRYSIRESRLPEILCKKVPGVPVQKWNFRTTETTHHCITGYQCPKVSKCVFGPMFTSKSGLLDGFDHCPKGEDETLDTFRYSNISASGGRFFIFVPLLRRNYLVRKFCLNLGYHLPSVHSEADKDLLIDLPRLYADSRSSDFDFAYQSAVWNDTTEWFVELGVDKRYKWTDGSNITLNWSFTKQQIQDAIENQNHVILKSDGNFDIRSELDQTFIICQEGAYSGDASYTFPIQFTSALLSACFTYFMPQFYIASYYSLH